MEIRNFVIIAHIDHGKSTLADRFLELTKTVQKSDLQPQYLDAMSLERERGITIRMHPVSMLYTDSETKKEYILNLIDTPGHVDFSYEVSRSLAAVEGAILLVDAVSGVQAQTLSNLEMARKQGLVIVPVVNKIDAPNAQVEETIIEVSELLGCHSDEVLKVSAKNNINIEAVIKKVIEKVPAPKLLEANAFRALIFDSLYDPYKGVVAYTRVFDGKIGKYEKIRLLQEKIDSESKEVGFFKPEFTPQENLRSGFIGYVATGIKDPGKVHIGETIAKGDDITRAANGVIGAVLPLPGYKEVRPVVFASLYPHNNDDYDFLKDALSKLRLNDAALVYEPESKPILGRGFRCGFLGMLHVEITTERLRRDFNLDIIVSYPSLEYKIIEKGGKEYIISSPADWPDQSLVEKTLEQYAWLEIVAPSQYLGAIMTMMDDVEKTYIGTEYIGMHKVILIFEVPLREIMTGFFDKLKSVTQGYASMDYKILEYRDANLRKLEILLNGTPEEGFARIFPESKIYYEARKIAEKLKEILPRQQIAIPIQACVGGKVLARETIPAFRKDVTGYLYGGDVTRKNKLLDKQKKGKKLMQKTSTVKVPPQAYLEVFKQDF
ncbi:MAG: translation elongation factor 4 [Candidatus Paceibacterota bacterium]